MSEQALEHHYWELDQQDAEQEYLAQVEERELSLYGTTEEALEKAKPDYQTDIGEAFSWLSDAQEALPGNPETTRQFINRAKYFLGKGLRQESEVRTMK